MTDGDRVLVADSCVGGLSVIKSLWRTGHASNAVLLADYQINPLGLKDDATIADVARRWMSIASEQSSTLIMACNTLSIRYYRLRQCGTVLPAVDRVISMVDCFEALVQSRAGDLAGRKVLVIGTQYTARESVYPDILAAPVEGVSVSTIAATELEQQVARIRSWDGQSRSVLPPVLRDAIAESDVAVLACTCFPIVEAELQALFPDVVFLDPGKFCSAQLGRPASGRGRQLLVEVTGDTVSAAEAAAFARAYLGTGTVRCRG